MSAETRAHAIRLVAQQREHHPSLTETIRAVAGMVGCRESALRAWMNQPETEDYARADPTLTPSRHTYLLTDEQIISQTGKYLELPPGTPRPSQSEILRPLIDEALRARAAAARSSDSHTNDPDGPATQL
jgi:transposase-like protein